MYEVGTIELVSYEHHVLSRPPPPKWVYLTRWPSWTNRIENHFEMSLSRAKFEWFSTHVIVVWRNLPCEKCRERMRFLSIAYTVNEWRAGQSNESARSSQSRAQRGFVCMHDHSLSYIAIAHLTSCLDRD
jgi:hypothetical protein